VQSEISEGDPPRSILLLTQTFPPDPAAVGQHFSDVAHELARRGHRVVVLTSAVGYDDPSRRYPMHERHADGVEVRRIRFASLGKSSIIRRIIASLAYMVQSLALGLSISRLEGVVFSTSPPFIGVIGVLIGWVRRVPAAYWVMDLNPDQLIATGKLAQRSWLARVLLSVDQFILRRSSLVVALDEMMSLRLSTIHAYQGSVRVIPPWSPGVVRVNTPRDANPFVRAHGLHDDTVIMYSGNHTQSNPLQTLLEASVRLREEKRLRFVFIGQGTGKAEVEEYRRKHNLPNILSLPFQSAAELPMSLAAADVHVVSMGEGMAGIVHPSKVYAAMAAGRPILYLGPTSSHVSDLLQRHDIGWHVEHGDVDATVMTLRGILADGSRRREEMGDRARQVIELELAPERLCRAFCDEVEMAFAKPTSPLTRTDSKPIECAH
jgi:colanic acid biosynthesis glycosyl transferase WcaI